MKFHYFEVDLCLRLNVILFHNGALNAEFCFVYFRYSAASSKPSERVASHTTLISFEKKKSTKADLGVKRKLHHSVAWQAKQSERVKSSG
jgi:hypothetical protein